MKNTDYAHEARRRQARRKRLDLIRRLTPSLPVLLLVAGIAAAIVANVRVTPVP